uniref:Uncharacterized protein n=1 Tax=Rhizophora mucronata TaxID=61149 RepID=A0A2P2N0K6_RHIMU
MQLPPQFKIKCVHTCIQKRTKRNQIRLSANPTKLYICSNSIPRPSIEHCIRNMRIPRCEISLRHFIKQFLCFTSKAQLRVHVERATANKRIMDLPRLNRKCVKLFTHKRQPK